MNQYIIALLLAGSLPTSPLLGCPAIVNAGELRLPLPAKRSYLQLYSIGEDAKGKRTWSPLPLQVDPMNAEGVLLSSQEGANTLADPFSVDDRIALRMEGFGDRIKVGDKPPCDATEVMELQDPKNFDRFGYLISCERATIAFRNPIARDAKTYQIKTPWYHYHYHPNNQLMYKSLTTFDPLTKRRFEASSGADLRLHLDIKRFFTINFTSDDVESYVEAVSNGPVGLATRIDFYLRLMFLKIDLKMATSASFFEDAAHIPMIIDAPVHSKERLHPGSGIAYTWNLEQSQVIPTILQDRLPQIKPSVIKKGWEEVAKIGLANCQGSPCIYRLNGMVGPQKWQMEIQVPRHLVENGFFPIWVPNVAEFYKGMDWEDEPDANLAQSVAIYFENSGVPKGKHRLDQWIRIFTPGEIQDDYACPRPVRQRRIVTIEQLTPAAVSH